MRSPRPRSIMGIVGLLGVVACGGDPAGPGGPDPTFIGTWAGNAWEGEAWAYRSPNGDTTFIAGSAPRRGSAWGEGLLVESMVRVRVVYAGPGLYHLGPGDAWFIRLIGGDVISSSHRTFNEEAGWISIVEDAGGRLSGQVHFDAQTSQAHGPEAPTVRFEGVFQAGVPE